MLKQIINEYILIPFVYASGPKNVSEFIGRVNKHIINPLLLVLFALAFVQFTVGVFKFFGEKKGSEKSGFSGGLEQGKRHMLWGIIGMTIMVSVFGIMGFITSNFGLGDSVDGSIKKGSGDGSVQMFLQE